MYAEIVSSPNPINPEPVESLSEYLPYTRASYSRLLVYCSSNEILPSLSQSTESMSLSSHWSESISGFIDQRLFSRSQLVNQYSNPSIIPSSSVSEIVGSVIPINVEMKFVGIPVDCHSWNWSRCLFPLWPLSRIIVYTL